ncbi:T-cell immunomodulatory protein [Teleopsis dalmanni]|uniref:T-cell immunomodulatory protein n=1 Tax=Teleopsis dalmanni TaxID=139649 RepID=UPI0018CC7D7A|nr:T-cell immunomodulatory protein [Teleopsis dalmanni]
MKYVVFYTVCLIALIVENHCNDITNEVFGNIKEGIVAAFGDFNSDELTDVFLIKNQKTTFQILYGADTEPLLVPGPFCTYLNREITSVVPGDFDGDALMDILITTRFPGSTSEEYDIYINWGGNDGINCNETQILKTKGEPIVLDYNRDMIIDLYGIDEFDQRSFWIFNKTRLLPTKIHQANPTGAHLQILFPNANAYIDMNSDFIADLFVQTKDYYEIWLGRADDSQDFTFNYTIDFNIIGVSDYTIGQATFADFELSGTENIILPVCFAKTCSNSTILVHDGKSFRDVHVNFRDAQGIQWAFVYPDPNDMYLKTITPRSGDFNMDGYPDLLITLQTLGEMKRRQTFLLENIPCKICNKPLKRTFEVRWNYFQDMATDVVAGTFYDFYQDGVLDVILIEKKRNGEYRPLAFRNTLDYDANFVKVIVLTGLINKKYSTFQTPLGRRKRTYGTNLPGPRIIYTTTTQDGELQYGSSVQLPQSSYFALQLPYTIFGLGRTSNFIDSLTVGLISKSRTWTQLIPNSQIIVVPKPVDEPQCWKAQLFVTPSKLILMSVVALGGTCLVIIFIILILYIKEKREDKLEKLQEAHRFHYDAM